MPIINQLPYEYPGGGAGGVPGDKGFPQQLPSSSAGKRPAPRGELQQASCSLQVHQASVRSLSPLLCSHWPKLFWDSSVCCYVYSYSPSLEQLFSTGDVHKGALLNVFYVKGWGPLASVKYRVNYRAPHQKATYCNVNGLCHSLPLEWIMNSPLQYAICWIMAFLKWTESSVEGAALLEEFKLWGHLLSAQQCKFLRPTAAPINKTASPYFVLITRRSQLSPFYRAGEPRQQGTEGTCLWPRTTHSPLRSALSARVLPPTAAEPSCWASPLPAWCGSEPCRGDRWISFVLPPPSQRPSSSPWFADGLEGCDWAQVILFAGPAGALFHRGSLWDKILLPE